MISHQIKDWMQGKPAAKRRSGSWPSVRAAHLIREPACLACGRTKNLEVHHIQPFHLNPELELEPTNLVTLCEKGPGSNCHSHYGHFGDWHRANPDVLYMAHGYHLKLLGRCMSGPSPASRRASAPGTVP